MFQYGNKYLENQKAIPIDTIQAPLQKGIFRTPRDSEYFNGICDVCPDSWGKHVIETAAHAVGVNLFETDYILYAGPDRIGALGFSSSPDKAAFSENPPWSANIPGSTLSLMELEEAAYKVACEEDLPKKLKRFFIRGSSVGGARPKATVNVDGVSMLAKFQHPSDSWRLCRVEDACMNLAAACGISVAETSRISFLGGKRDILLVRRFDRITTDDIIVRIPFASMMTMCNIPEHAVEGSYLSLATVTRNPIYNQVYAERDRKEIFRRMVFNILCGNCDDHPRNHGFLFTSNGWQLSPAYDITPISSFKDSNCLSMTVGKFGKTATIENALSHHEIFSLSLEDAQNICLKMKDIFLSSWETIFSSAGVSQQEMHSIAKCFPLLHNLYT